MIDVIKYVTARQMIIARKNNIPNNISDLDNKRFAIVKHTSMEISIEQLEKNNPLFKGILEKNIKFSQEIWGLDNYWKRSYAVTFAEYHNIFNLGVAQY
jgi:ABC-type amino acid transport substrate-binding protein